MELQQLKNLIDVNEIVGRPIELDKRTTLVPISRVSFGYVGGDGNLISKGNDGKNDLDVKGFGMTVQPLGLLLCGDKNTFIKVDESYREDKWLSLVKSALSVLEK